MIHNFMLPLKEKHLRKKSNETAKESACDTKACVHFFAAVILFSKTCNFGLNGINSLREGSVIPAGYVIDFVDIIEKSI